MENASLIIEKPAGLEDVIRSVRILTRNTRQLGESTASVLERELAMAISISEHLRDGTFSKETLKKARNEPLPAALRRDVHRSVDLVADMASVAYTILIGLVEAFVDQPRPPLISASASVVPAKSKG
jgi:hypothetical protein